MTSGQRMRRECEARLRALAGEGEEVVAVGTADEFAEPSGDLGVQGHWRFLVVTNRRLLFADWSTSDAPHEEIAFGEVPWWADGTQYHRYVVTLAHPPLSRNEWAPAHRFLGMEWGNAYKPRRRTQTALRFSHRDTAAAKALRHALHERGVPHEALTLTEIPREERIRGSRVELRSE